MTSNSTSFALTSLAAGQSASPDLASYIPECGFYPIFLWLRASAYAMRDVLQACRFPWGRSCILERSLRMRVDRPPLRPVLWRSARALRKASTFRFQ